MPNIWVYSSARRISNAVETTRPSSVTATHPASRSSAMSASSSPFWPRETAPIGYTRARFASAAFLRMYSVTPALSFTGDVFGMHATAVKPPPTAAAVPVATVSWCSCPGSRNWTCISMSPGQSTRSGGIATTVTPESTGRSRPIRVMRSSSIKISKAPSRPLAGSTTRPPLSSRFIFNSTRQEIQDRHAHSHAVGHLLENDRIRPVGDLGRNLHASVHRSRMHDDHVRFGATYSLDRHSEQIEVLSQRRKVLALHAFLLNAQHHDHVGVRHRVVDRGGDADAKMFDPAWYERRRSADPHVRAELRQQEDI